ncbi:hypothetical protein, partial [Metapseudomonas otitidis]|uniref:hypothetical protein n=1 Tax=Metapseudomonas otitidis TaxID=319939 RepID=UPI00197E7BD5
AHSTAAFLSVKLFFEEFFLSTQRLAHPSKHSSTSAGGESYSIQTRCQHPLSAINLTSRSIAANPQPLRNRTPFQTLNSLIFKEFSLSAVGVVRIIETSATASTPILKIHSAFSEMRANAFFPAWHT